MVLNGFSSSLHCPPHHDLLSREWIPSLRHQACSLDLNPIKNVWGRMARDVYGNGKQFATVNELCDATQREMAYIFREFEI